MRAQCKLKFWSSLSIIFAVVSVTSLDLQKSLADESDEFSITSPRWKTNEGQQWLGQNLDKIQRGGPYADFKGSFDTWSGFVDGQLVTVVAGYEFANPANGEIFIIEGGHTFGLLYETPVHAGPIEIVSIINGIITLRTVPGQYGRISIETNDPPNLVTFKSEITFRFDIRKRQFIQ